MSDLQEGDKATFYIGNNALTGEVQQRVTEPTQMGGKTVHASEDHPQVIIKQDGTGTEINRSVDKVKEAQGED